MSKCSDRNEAELNRLRRGLAVEFERTVGKDIVIKIGSY